MLASRQARIKPATGKYEWLVMNIGTERVICIFYIMKYQSINFNSVKFQVNQL